MSDRASGCAFLPVARDAPAAAVLVVVAQAWPAPADDVPLAAALPASPQAAAVPYVDVQAAAAARVSVQVALAASPGNAVAAPVFDIAVAEAVADIAALVAIDTAVGGPAAGSPVAAPFVGTAVAELAAFAPEVPVQLGSVELVALASVRAWAHSGVPHWSVVKAYSVRWVAGCFPRAHQDVRLLVAPAEPHELTSVMQQVALVQPSDALRRHYKPARPVAA